MHLFELPEIKQRFTLKKREISEPDISMLSEDQLYIFKQMKKYVFSVLSQGSGLLDAKGGTGKSFLVAKLIEHCLHTDPNMMIAVTATTNKAVKVTYRMADYYHPNIEYKTLHSLLGLREVITNRGEQKFVQDTKNPPELSCYKLIIVDECFAPDTLIKVLNSQGRLQEKYISDCEVGEIVLNCIGFDTITKVKRTRVNGAIKIKFNGKEVVCSKNHPFFTQRGWIKASELSWEDKIIATDKAMRILRGDNSSYSPQTASQEEILQQQLCYEIQDRKLRVQRANLYTRIPKEDRDNKIGLLENGSGAKGRRADQEIKPNRQPRDEEKNIRELKKNRPQTKDKRGKRTGNDDAPATTEGGAERLLDSGICDSIGGQEAGVSNKLQSGLSILSKANSNRSGWEFSQREARIRQEEGRKTGYFGLESFEIYEQDDSRLDRYRDAEGSLYFYDLSIKQHPSFTINDCLVHNCSMLSNALFLGDKYIRGLQYYIDRGLKVIFVGDYAQAPPINEQTAAVFDKGIQEDYKINYWTMDKIQRVSEGNPIIQMLSEIRTKLHLPKNYGGRPNQLWQGDQGLYFIDQQNDQELEFMEEMLRHLFCSPNFMADPDFAKVICYHRDCVGTWNGIIRELLHHDADLRRVEPNEKMITNTPVFDTEGEDPSKIILPTNEEFDVLEMTEDMENINDGQLLIPFYRCKVGYYRMDNSPAQRLIRIPTGEGQEILDDTLQTLADYASNFTGTSKGGQIWGQYYQLKRSFADVLYNYAITSHKSQGSTYENNIVLEYDLDENKRIKERNKLKYTAMSRASKRLFTIN